MLMERYARATFDSFEDYVANYHIDVPANYNFAFDCVDELARTDSGKRAIVWCNDKGEEKTFTFAEISAYSDAAARFFSSLGLGKGDPVMLILKRRYQFWFAVLGLMKIGAVAVPATHLLTKKDIVYRNEAASMAAILSVDDEAVMHSVEEAMPESKTVRKLIKLGATKGDWTGFDEGLDAHKSGDKPVRVTENLDMMMLYFTSGTTGMPKMVAHNFIYPLGHITTARYWHNLGEHSLHLTVADTGWAKAVWGKLFGQWLCGAAVFVYDHDRFSAKEMLDVIVKHKVTSFCAPPTVFRFMIKEDLSQYDLSALEYATTAGEPLNPEVFNQFRDKTGLVLRECYGQTEITPLVITTPYSEPRPGSMGKPSPAYDVLLLSEDGEPVEPGEEGEICIRMELGQVPGVFMGYYRDEALTNKVWHDGVYHTGDMAWRDEDGYLWFVGRSDDVIKSSGYRIGPFEVESALMEHPAVLECAITAVPDPDRGQVVKATIVLTNGYDASEALKKELQDHVKRITAPYKYPRIVEFVKELPKTISGKIQRVKIRKGEAEVPVDLDKA